MEYLEYREATMTKAILLITALLTLVNACAAEYGAQPAAAPQPAADAIEYAYFHNGLVSEVWADVAAKADLDPECTGHVDVPVTFAPVEETPYLCNMGHMLRGCSVFRGGEAKFIVVATTLPDGTQRTEAQVWKTLMHERMHVYLHCMGATNEEQNNHSHPEWEVVSDESAESNFGDINTPAQELELAGDYEAVVGVVETF